MSQYKFKINGKEYEVSVNSIENGIADVTVNGTAYNVEIEAGLTQGSGGRPAAEGTASLGTSGGTVSKANGGVEQSETSSAAGAASASAAKASSTKPSGAGVKVTSPLPGVIIDVCVSEGAAVKKGQKIAVIEAMKMVNDILAECDGSVSAIYVKKGDSVLEGADIASIA